MLPADLFRDTLRQTLAALVFLLVTRGGSLLVLRRLSCPREQIFRAASACSDLLMHAVLCSQILPALDGNSLPHRREHVLPLPLDSAAAAAAVRVHVLALALYVAQSVLLAAEFRQKRAKEYAIHHVLAGTAVALALGRQYTTPGLVVLLLHSVFDPLFQGARVMLCFGKERAAHRMLAVALYVFVATRLIALPVLAAWYMAHDPWCAAVLVPLVVLHVYWALALMRVYADFQRAKQD